MAKYILKKAKLTDHKSPFNGKVCDVLISGSKVVKIAKDIVDKAAVTIDLKGQLLCPGFIDLRAFVFDPGYEYRETYASLEKVAWAGGYTAVCVMPDTEPPVQSKAQIDYILKQNNRSAVEFLPLGAITKNLRGNELAELFDMKQSGAVAFSNANEGITSAGVMSRALHYVKGFDGTLFSFCYDAGFAPKGQMAEGIESTKLGLRGIPSVSEYQMVQRDIELLKYNGGKLHFSAISCAESVDIIRKAKRSGLQITADVAVMNLIYLDSELSEFDTHFKMLPPLRTAKDREALIKGLEDNTISAICSNHSPFDQEKKLVEFDFAEFGTISLQTCFSAAYDQLKDRLEISQLISKFSQGPAEVLNLSNTGIYEDGPASFTIINPSKTWTFTRKNNESLSENSPQFNTTFSSYVSGTISKGTPHLKK